MLSSWKIWSIFTATKYLFHNKSKFLHKKRTNFPRDKLNPYQHGRRDIMWQARPRNLQCEWRQRFWKSLGAFHSIKNRGTFEIGANGKEISLESLENTIIVEFPKCEPFNRKFREENQMRKFLVRKRNLPKFGYTSRGCPLFPKFRKIMFHSPLQISRNLNRNFSSNGKRPVFAVYNYCSTIGLRFQMCPFGTAFSNVHVFDAPRGWCACNLFWVYGFPYQAVAQAF